MSLNKVDLHNSVDLWWFCKWSADELQCFFLGDRLDLGDCVVELDAQEVVSGVDYLLPECRADELDVLQSEKSMKGMV